MLVAVTQNQQLFTLTPSMTRANLIQLRASTIFNCPQCKQPLQLKVGQVNTPHFAHLKATACEQSFSERESASHILGKQLLYDLFQRLKLSVQLEPYIPTLQQRPDLLIEENNQRYAIEFQCSRLTKELFDERTAGYQSEAIQPIWILKSPIVPKIPQIAKVSLNEFHRLFLLQRQKHAYLLTFDPETAQFMYYNHLFYIHKNTFIANIQPLTIDAQRFPFYIPSYYDFMLFKKQLTIYHQYRKTFLKNRLFRSREGVQDLFLRGIYEMRLSRELLPLFIGVPIQGAESMEKFSAEWQFLLFYFAHKHHLQPGTLDDKAIHYFFIWAKYAISENALQTVQRYIELLRTLSIESVYSPVTHERLFHVLYGEVVAIS